MVCRTIKRVSKTHLQSFKSYWKDSKGGKISSHELTGRQQENRRSTCETLLAGYKIKSFLHRLVNGVEKWICLDHKPGKSYVRPGQYVTSIARPNRFRRKTMLQVFWNQRRVIYYELLKPSETVTSERYRQKLVGLIRVLFKKHPDYQKR